MNNDELEFKLKDEIRRAEAMRGACNEALDEFFAAKTEQLFAAFVSTEVGDTDALSGIHHACRSIQSLQTEVQGIIDSGKLAAAQLESIDNNH